MVHCFREGAVGSCDRLDGVEAVRSLICVEYPALRMYFSPCSHLSVALTSAAYFYPKSSAPTGRNVQLETVDDPPPDSKAILDEPFQEEPICHELASEEASHLIAWPSKISLQEEVQEDGEKMFTELLRELVTDSQRRPDWMVYLQKV